MRRGGLTGVETCLFWCLSLSRSKIQFKQDTTASFSFFLKTSSSKASDLRERINQSKQSEGGGGRLTRLFQSFMAIELPSTTVRWIVPYVRKFPPRIRFWLGSRAIRHGLAIFVPPKRSKIQLYHSRINCKTASPSTPPWMKAPLKAVGVSSELGGIRISIACTRE